MTNECVRCGRPTADGYACTACRDHAVWQLTGHPTDELRPGIADMAGAARDVAHGLSRNLSGSGSSGKPGSRLPLDLAATARLDAVEGELTTWARHVAETRGIPLP